MSWPELVKQLRQRRHSLAMTQTDVSRNISGSAGERNVVSILELGRRQPRITRVIAWADALNMDVVLVPRERRKR